MKTIVLNLNVDHQAVLNRGLGDVIRDARLTDDGKIIIPVDLGGGVYLRNPAPCGTWTLTND